MASGEEDQEHLKGRADNGKIGRQGSRKQFNGKRKYQQRLGVVKMYEFDDMLKE